MRHVERSPADDVAQTGDDKDCTGAWDTAEEVGGGGSTGTKPAVQLVSQTGEKQKVVTDSHLTRGRVNPASWRCPWHPGRQCLSPLSR